MSSPDALAHPGRLQALRGSGLLGGEDEAFDRFTRLATRALGVPISLFSLLTADRQLTGSIAGAPDPGELELDASICQHVVRSDDVLSVDDARAHPLLRDNRAVTELGVVAYLGVPVHTPDGQPVGALCAIDAAPRVWTGEDREALGELATLLESELRLRISERRFRTFVESTSQVTFVADGDAFVTELSQSWADFTGQTPEQISGWGWADALHPDDRERVAAEWLDHVARRVPYATEYRVRGADGAYRRFSVQTAPIFDAKDTFVEYIGTCVDVEGERRAREELERQQAILNAFFDTSPLLMGVAEVSEDDLSLVLFNTATRRFLERAGEQIGVGSVGGQGGNAASLGQWLEAFHASAREGGPVHLSYEHPTADGKAPLSATVAVIRPTERGTLLGAFVAEDMTERAEAERRLRMSEDRLAFALESAQIGTWEYTFADERVRWSDEAQAIHGVLFDDRAEPARAQIVEEDAALITQQFAEAVADAQAGGETDLLLEYRVLRGGEERWVRARGRIYLDGSVAGRAAGTVHDVTDERRYEQALIAAREAALDAQHRAEEAVRLKTSIINNMSHEIRTPLTAILGFADLLAASRSQPDPEIVDVIQRSARRLLDTLDSVLYYAQLRSGTVFQPERFDAVRAVSTAVAPFAASARAAGLALKVQLPPEPVWTTTDREALARTVSHLVSNAVKFTREGRIDVRIGQSNGSAWVEVADTGVGMEPAFAGVAFEPFRQESEGLARRFEGSGLGLSIVRHLTDLMSARLDVTTEKGVGSTFRLWLPAEAD
jgi:PAS domain S-box-containing protein